jgi:hypothetical protein
MRSTVVAPFYKGWHLFNDALVAALAPLSAGQLALPVGSPSWPIWASVSHLAGMRVFWLCHVFEEPGAENNPFRDPPGPVCRMVRLDTGGFSDCWTDPPSSRLTGLRTVHRFAAVAGHR